MVYLLYGDDAFSIQEALASMKEAVRPPDLRDVNTAVFDGDQVSFGLLVATCDTVPFLAEKRLVVVKGLLTLFERSVPPRARTRAGARTGPAIAQWQELPRYLSKVPETTDLVFVDGHLSGTNPLLASIRPHVTARTFPLPDPSQLRQWMLRRAKAEGIQIEPMAVDALAEAVGANLAVLAVELQKLAVYRWGQAVRHEDVQEMVSYAKEANIFAAVDSMMEGRLDVAIRLVHQLLRAGRPPGYVLTMMARQVRLLILAKELRAQGVPPAEQGKRLGLSGYPLRKTLDQERRFTAQRLAEIHRKLLEADVGIKTTSVDEGLTLDVLVAEVSSSPAARRHESLN